jgi:uncharacterized membrane protein YdjX (TVP38/TMEM64 family)
VNIAKTRDTLRGLRYAMVMAARQVSRRRIVVTVTGIVILVAAVTFVPMPTAVELRDWATSVGPWFPPTFLAAHVVVTVLPFPRTAFTLAAGLLFGTALGVALAVLASTLSALIALWLVRAAGWQLDRLVSHPGIEAVDARFRQRGWAVVLSLRLIPAVPFSVINYAAGASAVRVSPYAAATFVGLIPGTLAFVVLGDAITGRVNPLLLAVSAVLACVGIAGLVYELRAHRQPAKSAGDPVGV